MAEDIHARFQLRDGIERKLISMTLDMG
jgi:hypothetical protein